MTKWAHNTSYFTVPNVESAYWAGFIAADGAIDLHNMAVRLRLAVKDIAQVAQFKSDIAFTGNINYVQKTNSCGVSLYGAQRLIYDLENQYNITACKSLILKPPVELEFERNARDLIKSYIIGYIDGDGCIKWCARDQTLILDIFSGSYQIINWIRQQLETEYGLPSKRIYSYANGHTYRLQGRSSQLVLEALAQHGTRHLCRKWLKLQGARPEKRKRIRSTQSKQSVVLDFE